MTPEQETSRSQVDAIEALRSMRERADRANLENYKVQLENGHMTEDLYLELTEAIYVRRPLWDAE